MVKGWAKKPRPGAAEKSLELIVNSDWGWHDNCLCLLVPVLKIDGEDLYAIIRKNSNGWSEQTRK